MQCAQPTLILLTLSCCQWSPFGRQRKTNFWHSKTVQHCGDVSQWQHEQRGRREEHEFHFCSRRARKSCNFYFVTRAKEPKKSRNNLNSSPRNRNPRLHKITRGWKIKPAQLGGKTAKLATLTVNGLNVINMLYICAFS
jgi:hypothetical protein